MNYQKIIEDLYREISSGENPGEVASYIPELGGVNPNQFGIHLLTVNNQSYSAGDCDIAFSVQSIAKVFSLALAYKHLGAELWKRVDVEPSGNPFNSLVQLEHDEGIP
ncbi:MAG TPA: glutaminase, partial [Cryomorphaceae bacterium]|nr:glutaminase [Cryomorphaceae bacterium]